MTLPSPQTTCGVIENILASARKAFAIALKLPAPKQILSQLLWPHRHSSDGLGSEDDDFCAPQAELAQELSDGPSEEEESELDTDSEGNGHSKRSRQAAAPQRRQPSRKASAAAKNLKEDPLTEGSI